MRFTKQQRSVVRKMRAGVWQSAGDLKVKRRILDNLHFKGAVEKQLLPGCGFSPDTFIVYRRF